MRGRVIEFIRYALDHKYPNEMWVYAPAGRGHTHTYGGGRACRPTGAHFSLWMCSVHSAPCVVLRGSPVLGGGMCREQSKRGGVNYPSCRRKDFTSALKPSRRSARQVGQSFVNKIFERN